ncbi:hypothetical protein MWU59_08715 [Flavobacteriaceae bacterium F08102]|nr:hypothetical protein [Flavobacteriaceae bacterium F08102]
MKDIYDTVYAKFWIHQGILHCIYKEIEFLDLAMAQSIVRERIQVQQDISYPIFCDLRGVKNSEKSARAYLAKNGSVLAKAVAIFDDRCVAEVMLQFYFTKSKPLVPSKLFNDYQQAIAFLQHYK